MAKHYFVVCGEVNEKGRVEFTIDHGTTEARFPEGAVWLDDKEIWVNKLPAGSDEQLDDELIGLLLSKKLKGKR